VRVNRLNSIAGQNRKEFNMGLKAALEILDWHKSWHIASGGIHKRTIDIETLRNVLSAYDKRDDADNSYGTLSNSELLKYIKTLAAMIKDQDDQIKRLQIIMKFSVGLPEKESIGVVDGFDGQGCFMAGENIERGDFVYIKKGYVYSQIKKGN